MPSWNDFQNAHICNYHLIWDRSRVWLRRGIALPNIHQASSVSFKLRWSAALGRDIAVPRAWFWQLVLTLLFLATRNTTLALPLCALMSLCTSRARRRPYMVCQRCPVSCHQSLFVLWGPGGRLKWLILPLSSKMYCYVILYLPKPFGLGRFVKLSFWRFVK